MLFIHVHILKTFNKTCLAITVTIKYSIFACIRQNCLHGDTYMGPICVPFRFAFFKCYTWRWII